VWWSLAAPAKPAADPEVGPLTVLLIENDPEVRVSLAVTLRGAGHRVIDTTDAAEAVQVVERLRLRPDLVVVDVVLPGLSGPGVVAELVRRIPDMPAVFVSGRAPLDGRHRVSAGAVLLDKPARAGDL